MAKAKRLTEAGVDRARPNGKRAEYADSVAPGLRLVVQPGGGKSWAARIRVNGKQIKITIGPYPAITLSEARKKALAVAQCAQRGEDPRHVEAEAKANTVEQVVKEWIRRDQKERGRKSWYEIERLFARDVNSRIGSRPVSGVTLRQVDTIITRVWDRAPTQGRRLHAYLHRFFRWAKGKGFVESNPLEGVQKPGKERKRDRVLSDGELAEVWKACAAEGWPYGEFVQALILTGCRAGTKAASRSETGLLKLRWSEVKEDRIEFKPDRMKTGVGHVVPLSGMARELMSGWPRFANCEYVFTAYGKAPYSAGHHPKQRLDGRINAARGEDAEPIEPWTLHDIRRTVATGLQKLKVDYEVRRAVLGHAVQGMGGVYDRHDLFEEKKEALEVWARHVEGLLSDEPAKIIELRGVK